jgi:hypothetical protein
MYNNQEMQASHDSRHVNVINGKFTYPDTQQDKRQVLNYLNTPVEVPTVELELSAQCTLQKSQDLNGHPLLCVFLAENFTGCLVLSS